MPSAFRLGNLYGSTELGLVSAHRRGATDPDTMGQLMPSDPTIAGADGSVG